MADLSTKYMGVELDSPVVVASCSLSGLIDNIKRAEEAGAGALVIKSLFEEQIMLERMKLEEDLGVGAEKFPESLTYFPRAEHAGPRQHLMWMEKTRRAVKMPLFGSLNAVKPGSWVSYAKQMEETGVDGLELNVYAVQTDPNKSASDIEQELYENVERVVAEVSIPVAVKLDPFYTSVANVAGELDRRGVRALVLFNRFVQPDIDTTTESLSHKMEYSEPREIKVPLRWIALLYGRVKADLAASTGAHDAEDVVKYLLAGATVVQVAGVLYAKGLDHISTITGDLTKWMDGKGYKRLADFRGRVSQKKAADPFLFERAQYVDLLLKQSFSALSSQPREEL